MAMRIVIDKERVGFAFGAFFSRGTLYTIVKKICAGLAFVLFYRKLLRIALSANPFLLAFCTMPVKVTARSAFTLFYEIRVVLTGETGISSLTGFALFVKATAGRTFVLL
jgi:hypothetical protein